MLRGWQYGSYNGPVWTKQLPGSMGHTAQYPSDVTSTHPLVFSSARLTQTAVRASSSRHISLERHGRAEHRPPEGADTGRRSGTSRSSGTAGPSTGRLRERTRGGGGQQHARPPQNIMPGMTSWHQRWHDVIFCHTRQNISSSALSKRSAGVILYIIIIQQWVKNRNNPQREKIMTAELSILHHFYP